MIYYQFNGYEGFKEIFGMHEHGNGTKSRRNKILLALMTYRPLWRGLRHAKFTYEAQRTFDSETGKYVYQDITSEARQYIIDRFYGLTNMSDMRKMCVMFINTYRHMAEGEKTSIHMEQDDIEYVFNSVHYAIDNGGVCFDGDTRAVRYINLDNGKVYKMKAGKLIRRLIDESYAGQFLPEQVKVWLSEDFAERWQAYARRKVNTEDLHLGETLTDFKRIYDSDNYASDFGSCMSHGGGDHASFYVDAVKAKAAWTTNKDGLITARCVVFTEVYDDKGNKYRLAERQYSSGGDNVLKRLLVDKLIMAGEIDGYKQIGVDCHNATAWVANDGTSWENKRFHIKCSLDYGDVMSYMDSFKWYDIDDGIAYNHDEVGADHYLAETSLHFEESDDDDHEDERWSEYHDCWIYEGDCTFVESRDDYFYDNEVCYAYRQSSSGRWYQEYCFEEDCLTIDDYYYYAGDNCEDWADEGICKCPECDEYFVPDRGGAVRSSLTDEWYCCSDCRDVAENAYVEDHDCRWDEITEEWYETDEHDWVRVLVWDHNLNRRRNGYARRCSLSMFPNSIINYKGNWYIYNLVWDIYHDVWMPEEAYKKMMAATQEKAAA